MQNLALKSFMAIFAFVPSLAAAPNWIGQYTYEYNGGGVEIIDYELTIGDLPTDCTLTEEGFQTDETIKCRASGLGNDLQIFFVSYDDGKTVNKYGVSEYAADKPLLTLHHNGSALLTEWGSMATDGKPAKGIYFSKKP